MKISNSTFSGQQWFILYNCHISYKANFGKGTFLFHKGVAMLIHNNVIIGKDCRIGMNVMITGKGPYKNVPIIGSNVWISPVVVLFQVRE